jgi:hypothetical protein
MIDTVVVSEPSFSYSLYVADLHGDQWLKLFEQMASRHLAQPLTATTLRERLRERRSPILHFFRLRSDFCETSTASRHSQSESESTVSGISTNRLSPKDESTLITHKSEAARIAQIPNREPVAILSYVEFELPSWHNLRIR